MIADFVESGKGLVITEGSLRFGTSVRSSQFRIRAGRPQLQQAVSALWPANASEGAPPPVQFLEFKIAAVNHPIMRGLKSGSKIADAVYHGMTVGRQGTLLATAKTADGTDEPALVVASHGKGRVF